MKLNRILVLDAMKKCLPGVETGSSIIEGTDTFVFGNGAIHSYNDSISVSTLLSTPEPLSGCVKSSEFFKLLSKISGDEVEIEFTEESWNISAGKMQAELALIKNKITEYIGTLDIPALAWKPVPTKFIDGIRSCKLSCNKSVHRGIFVSETTMVSTDLARINYFTLDTEMGKWWIDDPAAFELMKFSNITEYAISASWAHFKTSDGTVFSCKRKDETTFPYEKIMMVKDVHGKDPESILGILPVDLQTAVEHVSTMSKDISGWSAVKLTFRKDEIVVFSERASGKVMESVPLINPLNIESDISIWIDSEFILDAVKRVPDFYIKVKKVGERTSKAFVFHNADYLQIVSTISE